MDKSTSSKPSGIPRLSRLPRPSPSRETLKQPSNTGISTSHLRAAPSREHLSTPLKASRIISVASKSRERGQPLRSIAATGNEGRKNGHEVFRKPSMPKEQETVQGLGEGAVIDRDSMTDELAGGTPIGSSTPSRKPRPSLSERAMETLQNIPSSPAIRRRKSSFFGTESPVKPPFTSRPSSRPGSVHHQNDASMRPPSRSISSRPGSSGRSTSDSWTSTNGDGQTQLLKQITTPAKLSGTAKPLKTPSTCRSSVAGTSVSSSELPSPKFSVYQQLQSSTHPSQITIPKSGFNAIGAKPVRPQASSDSLYRKPPQAVETTNSSRLSNDSARRKRVVRKVPLIESTASDVTSIASSTSNRTNVTSTPSVEQEHTARKTSLALRDQIAKAKAAKRATQRPVSSTSNTKAEVPVIPTEEFDFGLSDNPFNQKAGPKNAKGLLRKRIDAARTDGRLNIAGMGFKQIPAEVMNMYSLDAISADGGSWAESVDLTRLIAADNELEFIDDVCFPDTDLQENADWDESAGSQFGGLETLDLHGNILMALPLGLRRLECLTTVNLSNNKLTNDCFQIVSQIVSLRDLKIAGNHLSGMLSEDIRQLQNLELLDLQRNALTDLPEAFGELRRLRVFNLQQNQMTSVRFELLQQLPLVELQASKNKLTGVLMPEEVTIVPTLQILDVACNLLTSLAANPNLRLPSLHRLNCSANRLEGLPDMSSWSSLLTLISDDNKIAAIPDGFVSLSKLKHVDFSGNDIRLLDNYIGTMDNLDSFRISGNPLKDKKFAAMTTEDLKRALKARIEPADLEGEDVGDGAFYSAPNSPSRSSPSDWPIKIGGVLDRSNTGSCELDPAIAASVASTHAIKSLEMQHNSLSEIPSSTVCFAASLTSLNLAHNEMNGDAFIKDDLELPVLKELNLSSNRMKSLQSATQHLRAPSLEKLDVSRNLLTDLPPLRLRFPALITLLASNNAIEELRPEAVKGLRTLDCSSNDIGSLNPLIGLLGGSGGLQWLDVRGNRFRVPKYTILEKGTEATLTWLRDKIPADDMADAEID